MRGVGNFSLPSAWSCRGRSAACPVDGAQTRGRGGLPCPLDEKLDLALWAADEVAKLTGTELADSFVRRLRVLQLQSPLPLLSRFRLRQSELPSRVLKVARRP